MPQAWNGFMDPCRLAKTTLIQQSIVSNLFGKSLICHNNGRVKLVRTWCDVQSTLCYTVATSYLQTARFYQGFIFCCVSYVRKHFTFEVIRHFWSTPASSLYTGLPMHACSLSVSPPVPNW